MSKEAMDFLMGGGIPSAKFESIGTVHKGVIVSVEVVQVTDPVDNKPKFWDDGKPQMQAVFVLQTEEVDPEIEDDDGRRRIFAKNNLKAAIAQAIKAAKYKGTSLIGGTLEVKYASNGKKSNPAHSPPKQYLARFTAPTVMDVDGSHDEANPPGAW